MKLPDLIRVKGTYIFCPRCGSPAVQHTRPAVDNHSDIRTEVYDVSCATCGLQGRVEENWFWKENDHGT